MATIIVHRVERFTDSGEALPPHACQCTDGMHDGLGEPEDIDHQAPDHPVQDCSGCEATYDYYHS